MIGLLFIIMLPTLLDCPTPQKVLQPLSYPNILTDDSRQSVRWVGAGLWNGLPVELRTQDVPYETFKKRLKKHLIERQ